MRPIVKEREIITKTKSATLTPLKPTTDEDVSVNGKPFAVRYASAAVFEKAHRKSSILHAGLFRRLAKPEEIRCRKRTCT